jgi:cytochrome c-type biogenesis protein CcmH
MTAERLVTPPRHPGAPDRHPGEGRDPSGNGTERGQADPGLRRDNNLFSLGLFPLGRCRRRCRHNGSRLAAWLLFVVSILLLATPAHAVRPDEMLADPALEARAREIGQELRCLVCRNQSIDDSDADLAHDLRVLVRERLKAGDTNDRVVAYIRSRYGDFVLLRPPFELSTILLWIGPLLILLLGAFGIARFYRARARDPGTEASAAALSPDEQRRLKAVLGEER